MGRRLGFVLCGLMLAGCFEEGGDEVRTNAANTAAQGLLAFPDIHNNLTDNPGLAGEALFAFLKTPVAAHQLVAPPFDTAPLSVARVAGVRPAPVPDCLTFSGPAGCDQFVTSSQCEAGDFTFTGNAQRACSPCENVTGTCAYNWDLDIAYAIDGLDLRVRTRGPISVSATEITIDTTFDFELTTGGVYTAGQLHVASCGSLTVLPGPPRKLVNAEFIVEPLAGTATCASVRFDGQGNPSVVNSESCACGGG